MHFRHSFFLTFLSCIALSSAQNENTGAGIIANLNGLSLVYVNLTATVNKLGFNTPQLASSLVKQYQDITTTELADEQAPQPQTAFNETIQFGILSAYHSLVTEDIRFLFALTEKAVLFSQAQREELVKIIGQQFQVDKTFGEDDARFGPSVLPIVKSDEEFLLSALIAARTAFGGVGAAVPY